MTIIQHRFRIQGLKHIVMSSDNTGRLPLSAPHTEDNVTNLRQVNKSWWNLEVLPSCALFFFIFDTCLILGWRNSKKRLLGEICFLCMVMQKGPIKEIRTVTDVESEVTRCAHRCRRDGRSLSLVDTNLQTPAAIPAYQPVKCDTYVCVCIPTCTLVEEIAWNLCSSTRIRYQWKCDLHWNQDLVWPYGT